MCANASLPLLEKPSLTAAALNASKASFGSPDSVEFVLARAGAGSSAATAGLFDPAHYRVVLFDQRGCGASTPHAELHANTTWHLVEDMEKLRRHLQIDKWLVCGGSNNPAVAALLPAPGPPCRYTVALPLGLPNC